MNDNAMLGAVLAAVPDAIMLTDDEGRFQYVCPNVQAIFERAVEDIWDNKTLETLMGPLPFNKKDLDREGVLFNVPWVISRPSGEKRYLRVHVNRVQVGCGTLLFACRDQTELEKSREKHRRFFEESLNIELVVGFEGVIQDINPSGLKILGRTLEELQNVLVLDFVHPDDRDATAQELDKLAGGKQTLSFENRILDSEGNTLWFLWTATPEMNARRTFAIGQDITKRKNAEQRLTIQHVTTSLLYDAMSWESISEELLRKLMEAFTGTIAECWLVRDDELMLAASTSGSDPSLSKFTEVRARQRFMPGEGIPGLVWQNADVVQVHDLTIGTKFVTEELAYNAGYGDVIGFPLLVQNKVMGTILIFNKLIQQADSKMRETLLSIGQQIGQFLAKQEVERQRTETAYLLHAIVDGTTDAIFVKDSKGRYLLCNKATAKFLGKSIEEIIGRTDKELLGDQDSESIVQHDNFVKESGLVRTIEETFFSLGKQRIFLATKAPYRNIEGDIEGIIGISRDITDRKQFQNDLEEHEQKLSEALEIAKMGYWERKLDSDAISWSDELYTIFGVDRNSFEHTVQAFLECIHPEDRESTNKRITHVSLGKTDFEQDYRIVVDGKVRVIHEKGRVTKDSSTGQSWVKGTAQDVTEQRQLKETLTEQEKQLKLLENAIDVATEGIIITDAQKSDNPITYVSSGFERITGYTAEEAIGRNCRFLQGPDTAPDAVAHLRNALQAGEACSVELLNYRKNGTSFWNKISIAPLKNFNKEVTHFVGVQTDATERRQLEEQYQQSQKMESVGQLAGGIAHDFNNLLTVIIGYCELIVDESPADHPLREYSQDILEAGIRASELTEQLLAFSRKQVLQPIVVDVNKLVNETTGLLQRLIGEQIRLNVNLDSINLKVRIDPTRFSQVLMNLAVNARDAMPRGGLLTIETKSLTIHDGDMNGYEVKPGRYILLSVSDTGHGMTKEVREKVFEPFFTTKSRSEGTGMGLSTVFGIVKQSGGIINVYSEPDHGSCFKIYLPEVDELETIHGPVETKDSTEGTETILIVEDDESVREAARRFLERFGYKVYVAEDPASAIKLNLEFGEQIDLLLTDVVMPQMSGRQLADTFMRLRSGLRVLFMSGYTDGAIVQHGILAADTDFIQKPFTSISLARSVRRVLDETP